MDSKLELVRRDLEVVWHPCTQMKDHEWLPMVPIARGSGPWLYDYDGRRYLDAISSWWVNLFGHANRRINAAPRERIRSRQPTDPGTDNGDLYTRNRHTGHCTARRYHPG